MEHDVYRSFVLNQDLAEDREPQVFTATYSHVMNRFFCPVLGCTGGLSTKWNHRWHFLDRHPDDLMNIPGEGVYCQCGLCHMQVSPLASGQEQTTHYQEGHATIIQHEATANSARALEEYFRSYGVELYRVEVLKYLG